MGGGKVGVRVRVGVRFSLGVRVGGLTYLTTTNFRWTIISTYSHLLNNNHTGHMVGLRVPIACGRPCDPTDRARHSAGVPPSFTER